MWFIGAFVLLLSLVPCGIVIVRAPIMERVVALEMAGIISTLVLTLLAQGMYQPSFFDLALALALLSFPTDLVFVHFLERWL